MSNDSGCNTLEPLQPDSLAYSFLLDIVGVSCSRYPRRAQVLGQFMGKWSYEDYEVMGVVRCAAPPRCTASTKVGRCTVMQNLKAME